jgi:hypothetical protein
MKNIIVFILSMPVFYSNDYLLQAIYSDYDVKQQVESSDVESSYSESYEGSEAEAHHWELGTPDNLPETIIIYSDEPSPCEL